MQIITDALDVEAYLIPILDAATTPSNWHNLKPATTGAYTHGIVRADLQQRVTPISRYCRVGIQGWAVNAAGDADLGAAFDLAAAAGRALEAQSTVGLILHAEVQSGPVRVMDDVQRLEFAFATVLLEVVVA